MFKACGIAEGPFWGSHITQTRYQHPVQGIRLQQTIILKKFKREEALKPTDQCFKT